MNRFSTWDIVAVPFPYTEGMGEKRRPTLIISSPKLTDTTGFYWLCMITSAENKGWQDDITISDLPLSGLKSNSIIRVCKIATLQDDKIIKSIGRLGEADQTSVKQLLNNYLQST